MLFITRRDNIERARVLHYLRVKALEQVLAEGDKFHLGLESGEIHFGIDNHDVPFINARAAANGLDIFINSLGFDEEVRPINPNTLEMHLKWITKKLSDTASQLFNMGFEEESITLKAASEFVQRQRFLGWNELASDEASRV